MYFDVKKRKPRTVFASLLACSFSLFLATSHASSPLEDSLDLVVKTQSATNVALSWQPTYTHLPDVIYEVMRDEKVICTTSLTFFLDQGAIPNTRHRYQIKALSKGTELLQLSNVNQTLTLKDNLNDGLRNGSIIRTGIANLNSSCGTNSVNNIADEQLDACLSNTLAFYELDKGLDDMRAYVARLRRHENRELIELGQRLFHSKALSENFDTSCASCHSPDIGCGSDNMSLPIGVNALVPDVVGLERSDGEVMPSVGRNSPPICNTALWVDSMFWDQRVRIREPNRDSEVGKVSTAQIGTPERDVTQIMNSEIDNTDPLRLLIAQAHFPVTAASEMGDPSSFASPQAYREFIASRLDEKWQPLFTNAYGDQTINFMRIAKALAAYQASFLFIDNPFFRYLDGDMTSLNESEKRGALLFYTNAAGCANCHDGVMFTPDRTRGPLYPQIGPNAVADGNAKNQFRMPSLLNVGLTAPYGDKGVFATLERVITHYSDVTSSLENFYFNGETCDLPQFSELSDEQCLTVVGGGDDFVLALQAEIRAASDRGDDAVTRNFTEQEIDYLAAFLRSLTDPKARPGSVEMKTLTPPHDGGPDGHQLDVIKVSEPLLPPNPE